MARWGACPFVMVTDTGSHAIGWMTHSFSVHCNIRENKLHIVSGFHHPFIQQELTTASGLNCENG